MLHLAAYYNLTLKIRDGLNTQLILQETLEV